VRPDPSPGNEGKVGADGGHATPLGISPWRSSGGPESA